MVEPDPARGFLFRRALPTAGIGLANAVAFAETGHLTTAAPSVVGAGSVFQVGLALLLVLAAIVSVAWVVKRLQPGHTIVGNQLRIVSATSVGQRERVVLMEVGATWLIVGVAPGQVTSLHSMPKPEITPCVASSAPADNRFASWLKQTMDRKRDA